MVCNGIGNKTYLTFLCHLFHNCCLSNPRRSNQQHRSLMNGSYFITSVFIFSCVDPYSIFNFFFCLRNVHLFSSFLFFCIFRPFLFQTLKFNFILSCLNLKKEPILEFLRFLLVLLKTQTQFHNPVPDSEKSHLHLKNKSIL